MPTMRFNSPTGTLGYRAVDGTQRTGPCEFDFALAMNLATTDSESR